MKLLFASVFCAILTPCQAQERFQQIESPSGPTFLHFSVGSLVFGYELSQWPEVDGNRATIPLERAVELAMPRDHMRQLIATQIGDSRMEFDDATYGTPTAESWKVRFSIMPSEGGFSGTPNQYVTLLRRNGTVISPRFALVSRYGRHEQEQFVSSMTLDSLMQSLDGTLQATEEEAKLIADRIVAEFLTNANAILLDRSRLRLYRNKNITIPIGDSGKVANLWQFDYKDGSQSLEIDPQLLAVWVLDSNHHSKITINRWYFDEPSNEPK